MTAGSFSIAIHWRDPKSMNSQYVSGPVCRGSFSISMCVWYMYCTHTSLILPWSISCDISYSFSTFLFHSQSKLGFERNLNAGRALLRLSIGGWHSSRGRARWQGGCGGRRMVGGEGSDTSTSLQLPAARGSASSCWPARAWACQLGARWATLQNPPPRPCCLSLQDVSSNCLGTAQEG